MRKTVAVACVSVFLLGIVSAALGAGESAVSSAGRPITFDDLFGFGRVSSPRISPDGRSVAYVVKWYDKEKNSSDSDIWLAPIKGGEPVRLTAGEGMDAQPCWSPDGTPIAFVSTRTGSAQIHLIPTTGGEAVQLTDISTGASSPVWSPDGKWIAFTSDVYPDCADEACNRERDEERESSPVKARLIDHLLYRHWNHWRDGKRSHLFVIPAAGGDARDLTPGDRDVPPVSLGSSHDIAFSPDGSEVCFVMNTDPMVAASTNNDLFVVPVGGGEPRRITENKANDNQPHYSPDGRFIAYRAMERPGFESDRHRLVLYERAKGKHTVLTEEREDLSIGDFVWDPDGKTIYFTAPKEGRIIISSIKAKNGKVKPLVTEGVNKKIGVSPDGRTFVFVRERLNAPAEIFTARTNGKKVTRLTDVNGKSLKALEMNEGEDFRFVGAEGDQVHGFLLKPPGFDPEKTYPLIFLVHGGPQGAWEDEFHYRWNAQMFAAPGYVVAMINFHGSVGYGQDFTDRISGDWGGTPYVDLVKGLDYLLETFPYIDGERVAASGASYGGYMINWIAGHDLGKKFRCLVNHDGVFELTSKYGSTEELWFPEWEFKGTPWKSEISENLYEKWSPHRFAANFSTPMLVIHGELDFRVPVSQAFQTFTALQRQGVPSKLLYYPDEGHFVLKPKNAELWWKTNYEWFEKWLNP